MATSTVENYLKAIFQLEETEGRTPSVGAIAAELEVTPGTVSVMLKQLSEQGLVKYVPRRHVSLLKKGRVAALSVVRRHRLIETFLVEIMGFDWSEVHEEAEVLEHVVSDRLLARIDEMLGHPDRDPHGDAIPGADGSWPASDTRIRLLQAESGRYELVRADDSDPDFLNWLSDHGLAPGIRFTLDDSQRVAGLLLLQTEPSATPIPLSLAAAARLEAVPVED